MNPEQLKAFQESLIKELGETMDALIEKALDEKMESLKGADEASMNELKEEVKSLALSLKAKEVKEDGYKGVVAEIFKSAHREGVQSEEEFKAVAEKTLKAMNETTDADGGYLVFEQFEKDIIKELQIQFPVLGAIRWFTLKKGDKVSFPVVDNGITTAYVDEGASGSASKPTFGRISIDINKTFSLVDITEELLNDYMSNGDLYTLILEMITESQGIFMQAEFVNGTGTGSSKIVGMRNLVGVKAYTLGGGVKDITYDEILNIEQTLPQKYRSAQYGAKGGDVKWLLTDYAYFTLRKLRDNGVLLFPELSGATPKLDLFEVVVTDDAGDVVSLATDTTGAEAFVLGNLKKFYGVRRTGMDTRKGYYGDNWKNDVASIKTNQRIGGKAARNDAFVVVSNGTVS